MLKKLNLLVVGGSGFIGAHLVKEAINRPHLYNTAYTYYTHPLLLPAQAYRVELHIEDRSLENCIKEFQPDILVYSAVPPFVYSEGDHRHWQINVRGPERTIGALKNFSPHSRLIYISTNAVFSSEGPHCENEIPDPQKRYDPYRVYGLTKAAGEKLVLEEWRNAIVARTAVVDGYTLNGKLYTRLAGLVARLKQGSPLERFEDRIITPTLVTNFTAALFETFETSFGYKGVLHLCGSEAVSDYQYGLFLTKHLHLDPSLVKPGRMADSPEMARSPRNHCLNVSFTQSLLQTRLLGINEQLAQIFPVK